jgi:Transforming acidic coiled-coil-containing protein (TACC), C-terminal
LIVIVFLFRRYERTKEVIGGFKQNEDMLKSSLELVTNKYRHAEERFEHLRAHAESKLAE